MLTLEECEEVCMGMGRLSERDAVVSAANVLMVALLKMNRLIVPAFLRWRRAVRWRQIQNARQDLEREREKQRRALAREEIQMHRAKNGVGILERISRVVGTGTKEPYTTQEPLLPSNGTHEPHLPLRNSAGGIGSGTPAQSRPSRPAQRQERRARRQSRDDRAEGSASGEPAHADAGNEGEEGLDEIQAAAESFFSRGSSSRSASRSSSAQQGDSEGGNTIDVFERRVQQLQLERAQDVYMGVYTSVGTTFVTFASIVIYSTVIISLVLALFPFERGQAVIFSFSLVATALVSESEVLRKGKTEEEKKKEKESKMKDLKNFRYKSKAPKGGANNLEAMENADHEADDVEDFSDLD